MLMTAAGTIPPAKVLVLGAGVAGLQALATARRLGAQTTGYDVRPEVGRAGPLAGRGLARARDRGRRRGRLRPRALGGGARGAAAGADRRDQALRRRDHDRARAGAPRAHARHRGGRGGHAAGSVIVDLAGETGGNCELTEPGETVVVHDVTIVSPLNLPAKMPEHASQLYARNVQALLELMRRRRRWRLAAGARLGRRDHRRRVRRRTARASERRADRARRCAAAAGGATADAAHQPGILVLAGFVGFAVISKVPEHAAHAADVRHQRDPRDRGARRLCCVTGAATDPFNKALLTIAVAFGTINVVGGFLVTDRMLEMFKPRAAASRDAPEETNVNAIATFLTTAASATSSTSSASRCSSTASPA